MGVMDTVTGAIAKNTGNIEKAVIEVIDRRRGDAGILPPVQVVGGQGGIPGVGGGANAMAKGAKALKKVKGYADKGLLKDEMGDMDATDEMIESIVKRKTRVFVVQFNPSTLQLSGTSGEYVQKLDFSDENKSNEASYAPSDTMINMSQANI